MAWRDLPGLKNSDGWFVKAEVASQLLRINQEFYEDFGDAFAATRHRIQPGVRRFLNEYAQDGDWLDLGCGSGALGIEWSKAGLKGSYTGLDFSQALLTEARNSAGSLSNSMLKISYIQADLMDEAWDSLLQSRQFSGILSFAALHHIPGAENRQRLVQKAASCLRADGCFVYSVWQFQNSEKLMSRILPWETVGIDPTCLDPGDTLLDWRFALPGMNEKTGKRYVHLFSPDELTSLAVNAGFEILTEFYSDGKTGNLARYQIAGMINH